MTLKTMPFDAAKYLDSDETIAAYLTEAFRDGDPALIAAAIGDVARARGMSQLAKETGITREALYQSFSPSGNPTLATMSKVLGAIGMEIAITPVA